MNQKSVRIGEIDVPVIVVDGEVWFPCVYIAEKVLLRKARINFNKKYVRKFMIDYGLYNGSVQEVNCISKENLIKELSKTRLGWLTVEQRIGQNHLHSYLGIKLLPIDEQDTKHYDPKWLEELDDYTKDVVQTEIKIEKIKWFRRCSSCNNSFPLTKRFFAIDNRANKGFIKICKICDKKVKYITHPNEDKNRLIRNGEDLFNALNEDYLPKIFESYRKRDLKRLPDCYENKESYAEMIWILFNDGLISEKNLTQSYLKEMGLKGINKYFAIDDIYKMLYGEDFYLYYYKYPKFSFRKIKLTYEIANVILNNYINEYKIIITDIFTFDFEPLLKACHLSDIAMRNLLYFIVQFYHFKYAGYKFKTTGAKYYSTEENVLFDLKYFIEQDMKIDINKVPLYLTRNVLQKRCKPLYHHIITNKNGSIFEWVDKLYPNKFIQADFEINPYRNEFDSDTECFIHEILVEEFGGNVIYNQRNNSDTVKLKGKVPDWFLFTNNGVWVIEYFGFYDGRHTENNRIRDYIAKTEDKISKYESIVGYNFLYLYKTDVDNNFLGLREKIGKIKVKLDASMD